MADEKPMIVMTAAEADRRALAEAMAELKANPLDETVEGGAYLNAAGQRVNAHGHLIERAEREADAASEPVADDAEPARKAASHKRR